MKKLLLLGIVLALTSAVFNIAKAESETVNNQLIQEAIEKYKSNNYLGCISDLRLYTEKDPSNAVAWYYLGNSYMNIAMKEEAHSAFEKVIGLNTVPKLTSYSIQAELCMDKPERCNYYDFSHEQIKKLIENPSGFLQEYFASLNNKTQDTDTIEIENLIKGTYPNNIHPSAKKFIDEEEIKMKTTQINEEES